MKNLVPLLFGCPTFAFHNDLCLAKRYSLEVLGQYYAQSGPSYLVFTTKDILRMPHHSVNRLEYLHRVYAFLSISNSNFAGPGFAT